MKALKALKTRIHGTAPTSADPWFFPSESKSNVQGFCGTDPILLVAQRPSFAEWNENHKHRRALYDGLADLGAGNAHLTDLYKYRGPVGKLCPSLLVDFETHLGWIREEIAILNPVCIIAMGDNVYDLLKKRYLRDEMVRKVWHFGALRYHTIADFQAKLAGEIEFAYQYMREEGFI